MKTYKKVNNKIVATETVEVEVDIQSIENRIKTLNKAIELVTNQFKKLQTQSNTYEIEKKELEDELKKIKKLDGKNSNN